MRAVIDSAFGHVGEEQAGAGSYYSRRDEDMHIDLAAMDDDEILRRVRSFGVRTQGVTCRIGTRAIRVFEARAARHPALLAEFEALAPGALALAYDGKLLVRTRQGLVVLTSFSEIDERPGIKVRGRHDR
jgi:methionyl-tRNA formyltransferase